MAKKPGLQAITVQANGIANVIKTQITVINQATKNQLDSQGIWDTGATGSAITATLANQLGLVPIGKSRVKGVHGVQVRNVYVVLLALQSKAAFIVRVTECDELTEDKDCGILIGMDVINIGDFAITNYNGRTKMSFRVPSQEEIDFVRMAGKQGYPVQEHPPISKPRSPEILKPKVGRNDPCPCGSGKKYKHCCLIKGISPN